MSETQEFNEGQEVKLCGDALLRRDGRMKSWRGMVDGFQNFSLKMPGTSPEINVWVRVNWGQHGERSGSFVWLERPEDLVLA